MASSSNTWRQFCWKNTNKYFATPVQKKHQDSGDVLETLWNKQGKSSPHILGLSSN